MDDDAAWPSGTRLTTRRAIAVASVLFVAGALAASFPSTDPDAYFHLALGREVASSGFVSERLCLFSLGKDVPNQSWLYDLLLWQAYDGLGETGVHLYRVFWAGLLFWAVGLLCLRRGAGPLSALVVPVLFAPLVREWLEVRPHVAGYAFSALALLCLDALSRSRKWALVALLFLFALWANIHGSFPMGVVLVACHACLSLFCGDRGRVRRDFLALALVLAATFVNPFGLGPWAVAVAHLDPRYRAQIPEWEGAAWGKSPVGDELLLVLCVLLVVGFLHPARRRALPDLVYAVVLGVPGLLVARFLPGLLVGGSPALAGHARCLGRHASGLVLGLLGIVAAVGTVVSGVGFGSGLDRTETPQGAMQAALDQGVEGGIFGPMEAGGYVEFVGHPRLLPFIDGRVYVHGASGVSEYLRALERPEELDRLDDQWHFAAVLVDITHPAFSRLAQALPASNRFKMVWLDSHYALFVRAMDALWAYRVLRPTTDPRYLLSVPDVEAARAEVERVLLAPEGQVLGLLLRGVLALREAGMTKDALPSGFAPACVRAKADLAKLVTLRPDVEMFRVFFQVARRCAEL